MSRSSVTQTIVRSDPYRNADEDRRDALEYAAESFDAWPTPPPCLVETRKAMPLTKVLAYGDYSAWGEWQRGELLEVPAIDLPRTVAAFRGPAWAAEALRWPTEGFPAIVIVDSRYGSDIADGRGRTSLAVGLDIKELPVILLTDCPRPRRAR